MRTEKLFEAVTWDESVFMKTTILEYISSMGDGGAETLVKDYALLMDRELFDVRILITRPYPGTANTRILEENKIPVLCIYPRWNLPVRIFNKLFGRWYRPYRLQKIVKQQKVDVLHVHMNLLATVAPVRKCLNKLRLLYTCHNLPSLMIGKVGDAEYEAARLLIRDNGLQMIALHSQMKEEIDTMFGITNTEIIRNGIRMERFANVQETKEEIRESLGISQDAFVIGHVGRFTYQKNHELLIRIFDRVVRKKDNAYLLLIGSGEGKEPCRQQLQDLGYADRSQILSNRSDIPQLMKAMDVFVFPSRYEGLPVTMVEAQASRLRCVVSDKISESAFLTDLVIPLSISDAPEIWAEKILDKNCRGNYPDTLDAYDMKLEIKRLEKMYTNS